MKSEILDEQIAKHNQFHYFNLITNSIQLEHLKTEKDSTKVLIRWC